MIPNDILCCTHRSLPYPVIINVLLAAEGNRCIDPQPNIIQREILKCWSPSKPSPQRSGSPAEETLDRLKSERGLKTPGEQDFLNQLSKVNRSSQRWKQQAQGLHGSAQGPLALNYKLISLGLLIC